MNNSNLTQMFRYFYLSLLAGVVFFSSACSTTSQKTGEQKPVNPVEMHVWIPPSPHELELRRARQEALDTISREIEHLYLKQQALDQQTYSLKSDVAQTALNTEFIEYDLQSRIKFQQLQQDKLKEELARLDISQKILKTNLRSLEAMRSRPRRKFSPSVYTAAIRFLKNGQYKQSIQKFNQALQSRPPASLTDNIRFGLGTAYYKLRKYSKAIDQLNSIIRHHPNTDKWHISHVMLGMILNTKGEKSRALYILQQALDSNPPDSMRKMIDRMILMVQGGTHASG